MNSKIITAIALKLFAIWVIVQVILQIPFAWQIYYLTKQFRSPEKGFEALPYLILISLVICGIVAGIVIFRLGQRVFESLPEQEPLIEIKDTERLFIQLLGIMFIVTALSRVPSAGVTAYGGAGKDPLSDYLWLSALLLKIVIGFILVIKSDYVQSYLKRMR